MPRRYRGVSFDREPLPDIYRRQPEVVRAVRQYVDSIDQRLDDGRGIWFTGDYGTGKTTLAMLISKSAIEAGRTVAIYSLPQLLAVLRDSFRDDGPSLTALIDRLVAVDLLHIDDLGAEQSSAWVLEQLYTIVNGRYEDERAMVVTTNLLRTPRDEAEPKRAHKRRATADEETDDAEPELTLEEQVGERTVSRLFEMCGDPLWLFGEDKRYEAEFDLSRVRSADERPFAARRDAEPDRDGVEIPYGEPRRASPGRRYSS